MDLLIKGMNMPNDCCECPCSCSYDPWTEPTICKALFEEPEISDEGRLSECPLVEIPTPHGDLIDRDYLLNHSKVLFNDTVINQQTVINAPAVIKKEE